MLEEISKRSFGRQAIDWRKRKTEGICRGGKTTMQNRQIDKSDTKQVRISSYWHERLLFLHAEIKKPLGKIIEEALEIVYGKRGNK